MRTDSPEPVIVVAIAGEREREQIRRAAGGRYRLEPCERCTQLLPRMARADVGAIVTRLNDLGSWFTRLAVEEIGRRFPSLPFIIYAPPAEAHAAARLADLGRAVPGVLWVERIEDLAATLARVLAVAPVQGPEGPLMSTVSQHLDGGVYAFTRLCVYNPGPTALLEDLIGACGLARRTLEFKLRRSGYPTPREILAGTTVTVAMWFYDTGLMTLDAVAAEVGLESGNHLSALCHRRFELGPVEVRDLGWRRIMLPLWAWQFRLIPPRELLAA
ncbi:MAG: hypothetical protein ACREON_00475 [Gemmatimonadaceae bacterium]